MECLNNFFKIKNKLKVIILLNKLANQLASNKVGINQFAIKTKVITAN
jgi:hypothetical protein